jgi:inhibitor of cysteine peptidase
MKMKKELTMAVLLSLLLAGAAACAPSSKEVKVSASDNGREIELGKGHILVISLEGNPTTGYTGEVEKPLDENILRQVGEPEFKPESDLVGAPGVQTLRFEAVNAGQMTLNLVYHRPWEEDVEPEETFSLQMVVR